MPQRKHVHSRDRTPALPSWSAVWLCACQQPARCHAGLDASMKMCKQECSTFESMRYCVCVILTIRDNKLGLALPNSACRLAATKYESTHCASTARTGAQALQPLCSCHHGHNTALFLCLHVLHTHMLNMRHVTALSHQPPEPLCTTLSVLSHHSFDTNIKPCTWQPLTITHSLQG